MGKAMSRWLDRPLGFIQWPRIGSLEDVLFSLRKIVEYGSRDSEILGKNGFRCPGQVVGQEKGRVFREVPIIKDE